MSLPNVLIRLHEDITVIAPGDRSDLLPGLVMAHQSGTFPHLSAIVLTGGYQPPEPVARLIDGVQQDLPIIITDLGTFDTAMVLHGTRGQLTAGSRVKIETALRVFNESVDGDALLDGDRRRRWGRHHAIDVPVPVDRAGPIRSSPRGAPRGGGRAHPAGDRQPAASRGRRADPAGGREIDPRQGLRPRTGYRCSAHRLAERSRSWSSGSPPSTRDCGQPRA